MFYQRKKAIPVIFSHGQCIILDSNCFLGDCCKFFDGDNIRTMNPNEIIFWKKLFKCSGQRHRQPAPTGRPVS
jgi:hypothetical protein